MPKTIRMKNNPAGQWATAFALTLLSSCARHEIANSCISRHIPLASTLLMRQSGADSVYTLLRKNSIPVADVQPWQIINQDLSLTPTTGGSYQGPANQVFYYQYIHGLPLWSTAVPSYIFDSTGLLIPYNAGGGYQGTLPDADTSSRQSLIFLRERFLRTYNQAHGHPGIFANQFADSCLVAILGYMDATSIPGSAIAPNTQLKKTWMVTPANDLAGPTSFGPVVYVIDSTGESIYNDRSFFQ